MTEDQFAFLGEKFKESIAVMSLGVLLFLPASLGFGKTIIQVALGQTSPPTLDVGDAGGEAESTSTANASTFLVRGIIGSSLPTQDVGIPSDNNSSSGNGYVLAGRFRVVANQSIVDRFVAEMDIAATNGSTAFHNITIEETAPFRFQLTESGNGTNTTTGSGSIPPISSNLMTRIYVDGNTPVIDNVPLTISLRGQVLAIEGIDIDETKIMDPAQRDILSVIDGQSFYGIASR